jgi:ribosomal-protein-alanine N-acetyltransferase
MKNGLFSDAMIETPRVFLRPFNGGDLSAFMRIASQEEILEHLPSSDRMTPEQLEEVFGWLIRCYETNTCERIEKFTLPIVLKDTGEIVGWCGLGPLEFDPSQIEIYFVIACEYWGMGLATEAAGALLDYAFNRLGLQRVVAVANPANHASIRVTQKIGMRREGPVRGLGATHRDYEGYLLYSLEACDRVRPAAYRQSIGL